MVIMSLEEAHEILGVNINDSEAIIKTAYKKMALKTHPDKNPNDPNARLNFQRVSEAYKRITEPESFANDEEEGEMSFDDLNEMFMAMFSEMMPGFANDNGGIEFGMLEMMMANLMMNEMGYHDGGEDGEDYDDDDDDDDNDGLDIRAMEAFLAAEGLGGYEMNGMGIDLKMLEKMGFLDDDYDNDDDEDDLEDEDEDDYYPEAAQRGRQGYAPPARRGGGGSGSGGGGNQGLSFLSSQQGFGGPMSGMDMDMMMMLAMLEGMDGDEGWDDPTPTRRQPHNHHQHQHQQEKLQKGKSNKTSSLKKDDDWLTASEDSEDGTKQQKGRGKGKRKNNKKNKNKKQNKEKKEEKKSVTATGTGTGTGAGTAAPPAAATGAGTGAAAPPSGAKAAAPAPRSHVKSTPPPSQAQQEEEEGEEEEEEMSPEEMSEIMMNAMNNALRQSTTTTTTTHSNTTSSNKKSATKSSSNSKKNTQQQQPTSRTSSEEKCFYNVGDRVVIPGGHAGTIAYIGAVDYSPGEFIGVILDQPVGKNNGTIKGIQYFSCGNKRGLMVKSSDIRPQG